MKFLVPNYSCLQNPWLRGCRPQIPFLSVLNWICWTPPEKNSWVRHCRDRKPLVLQVGGWVSHQQYELLKNQIAMKSTPENKFGGFWRWPMLRLKTVRMVLQLGTWNVRTMLQGGKMQEIANELETYNTHIAALQAIGWLNERWIDKKDYTWMYGGETNIRGRNGYRFHIEDARKSLTGFEPVNGRIAKIWIKGKLCNTTIINMFIPNKESELEDTEKFCDDLMRT